MRAPFAAFLAVLFQAVCLPSQAAPIAPETQVASGTVVSVSGNRLEIQPDAASATQARVFVTTPNTRVLFLANQTDLSALSPGAQGMIKYVDQGGHLVVTEVRLIRLGRTAAATPRATSASTRGLQGNWMIVDAHVSLSDKDGAPAVTHIPVDQPYYLKVRIGNTTGKPLRVTLHCPRKFGTDEGHAQSTLDACGNGGGIVDPGGDTFTITSPELVRRGRKLAEILSGSQQTLSVFITVSAHGAVLTTTPGAA